MRSPDGYSRPAIAGTGLIACGLAACASALGEVLMLARSEASVARARERAEAGCGKVEAADPERIAIVTDPAELGDCDLVVEAIVEDLEAKAELLGRLGGGCPGADLATTSSSLPIGELGERCGHSERLYGLHVFNPVQRMDLVELCFPHPVSQPVRERARTWCGALGKTPIEVPDQAGFVVNRLLFPFLFDAVRLMERTGMSAEDVDGCMKLGAGHPMGPLAVLDFVGLDVAKAIGDSFFADAAEERYRPPGLIEEMIGEGKLGRKSGSGFYDY